jgi:hypothetical protein
MAGALTISTLNDSSGVLATQNGMSGIAKAWAHFNQNGSISILNSFNISSITYNAVGSFTVNFTTAMPNANYAVAGSGNAYNASYASGGIVVAIASANNTSAPTLKTTTQCGMIFGGTSNGVSALNLSTIFYA